MALTTCNSYTAVALTSPYITTSGQTTVTRAAATNGWPGDSNGPASGNFPITVTDGTNFEIMLVTGGQGTTTLTVTRAYEIIGGIQTAYSSFGSGTTMIPTATAALLAGLGPAPLTRNYYNPASAANVSSGVSGAWLAVDSTNLTVTFVMPAAGKAYVELSAFVIDSSNYSAYWGLLTHDTTTLASDVAYLVVGTPSVPFDLRATGIVAVSGTAGTSYTFDWGASSSASTAIGTRYGGGNTVGTGFGPAVMTVWAS